MTTECRGCEYSQYCKDCKPEWQVPEEVIFANAVCRNGKIESKILIVGNLLYHNGKLFHIVENDKFGNDTRKRTDPNIVISTKEGYQYYLREIGTELKLIKIRKIKEKKEGKPQRAECQKNFIGIIPQELWIDTDW